jgi:hypothetical protein
LSSIGVLDVELGLDFGSEYHHHNTTVAEGDENILVLKV